MRDEIMEILWLEDDSMYLHFYPICSHSGGAIEERMEHRIGCSQEQLVTFYFTSHDLEEQTCEIRK